jgi:hypothetical protein
MPGHYAAVLNHEKTFNMSYNTTEEARRLRANGADMATIINQLTSQGEKGWLSKHKLQSIQRLLDHDLSSFTYQPTPGETQMSSLIRMLSEREKKRKDIKFIYLFSYATDANLAQIKEGHEDDVTLPNVGVCNSNDEFSVMDSTSAAAEHPKKGIFASLVSFFLDKASSIVTTVPLPVSRGARALAMQRAEGAAMRAPNFLDGAWHIGGV